MKELSISEIQKGSLEILKIVSEVCKKLELTFFLAYGTLIGAVRHHGFIPWDDDIDIMMPRKDYELLINYFHINSQKLYPLKIINMDNEEKYPYMITRVIDERFIICEKNINEYGLGLFIDIYPLDGVGNNKKENKKILKKTRLYLSSICLFIPENIKIRYLQKLKRRILRTVLKRKGKKYFMQKLNNFVKSRDYDKYKYIGCIIWENDCYEKSLVEKTMLMKFEDAEFPVPIGYHEMLTQIYGNYMELPPENERIGHHEYRAFMKD